jgi:hypothetical protein
MDTHNAEPVLFLRSVEAVYRSIYRHAVYRNPRRRRRSPCTAAFRALENMPWFSTLSRGRRVVYLSAKSLANANPTVTILFLLLSALRGIECEVRARICAQ